LLTPPLATEEASGPSASQGASIVTVSPQGVSSRTMLWYTGEGTSFTAGARESDHADEQPIRALDWTGLPWLWRLGATIPSDLSKAAVLGIAMLAAFLTAVAVWQIPSPSATLTTTTAAPASSTTTSTTTSATTTVVKPSLLDNNFARTVVSGLGGLALATLMLDSFETAEGKGPSQQFYVVWFIFWFFA
jgi:hypothetical protein